MSVAKRTYTGVEHWDGVTLKVANSVPTSMPKAGTVVEIHTIHASANYYQNEMHNGASTAIFHIHTN